MKAFRKRRRVLIVAPLALCLSLLIVACFAPQGLVYERDGKRYGTVAGSFRERWWNYFERGQSYGQGGFWQEAVTDHRAAIEQRPRDRRRARTYGLHFVDYFPNRELGIAQLALEDYQAALKSLERSIAQEPSARAMYFLDRAREQLLRLEGGDEQPPSLTLATATKLTTREPLVHIEGIARDDRFVARLRVDDITYPQEVSVPELPFRQQVELREGEYEIEVEATDLLGRTARTAVHVVADFHGPQVVFEHVAAAGINRATIAGHVADATRVVRFTIGGEPVPLDRGNFTVTTTSTSVGIIFEAEDEVGNRTRGTIPISAMIANDGWHTAPVLLVAAAQVSIPTGGENSPPVLDLRGWERIGKVSVDRIYLEGNVRDDRVVTTLSINGREALSKPGRLVFFGEFLTLVPGDNTIVIRAADGDGNAIESTLRLRYEPPPVEDIGSRARLTVLPLERRGDLQEVTAVLANDNLLAALLERRRFKLVERRHLDAVLAEQRLTVEGLADPKMAVRVGRLATAELVLAGSAFLHREGIEIYLRLINTETGTVLAAIDAFGTDFGPLGLKKLCAGLAFKVERDFPLVHGWLVRWDRKQLITDLGREDGVRPEMKIWLYAQGEMLYHPITGTPLGREHRVLGAAALVQVGTQTSTAAIVGELETWGSADQGLRVITR